MARGDKKNGVDGYRPTGFDSMGRPTFAKDKSPKDRSVYTGAVKRALNPMGDMSTNPDNETLDQMHPAFWAVMYGEQGGTWEKTIGDATLVGSVKNKYDKQVHSVIMHRDGNNNIVMVDEKVEAVLNASDMREISMRYAENALQGEEISRRNIKDVVVTGGSDAPQQAMFTNVTGTRTQFVDNGDGETFTCYHIGMDEEGHETEPVVISNNVPYEDAVEIANEVAHQESKGGFMSNAVQAGIMAWQGNKMLKKYRKNKNKNKKEEVRVPFDKLFNSFFAKAFRPFDSI